MTQPVVADPDWLGESERSGQAPSVTAPLRSRAAPALNDRIDRTDRHVSARIREARIVAGLSLQELAATLGITYQQLFKYEAGQSRIAAGRLAEIAAALRTAPGWFFEGLADHTPGPFPRRLYNLIGMFDSLPERERELLLQFSRDLASQALSREKFRAVGREAARPQA